MGDISKTFRLLDGGLTRALDSAAAEQAALASPPRPLRSPAALNVLGHNDVLARRPGTGVIVPSPDPLAPVWFISDFASWSLNSLYPFGDLLLITETDPDDTDQVVLDWPTVTGRDYTPRTWPPRRGTPTAPPSFQLLSPVHGATCQLRAPTFRWSACPGATAYRLYIHTSSRLPYTQAGALDVNALTHRAEIASSSTTYTPDNPNLLDEATTYYVWVYAVLDGNKLTRALATPFKFTTKLPAPTGLTTGSLAGSTPTLTWDVNSAAAWVVQIRQGTATTAEQFAALPVIHTSGVRTQASYTVPPNLLVLGTTYSYVVTARDVAPGTPGCEVASLPATFTPSPLVVDTIALNYSQSSPMCAQRGAAAVNTGKSYPFPTKLRVSGNFTVDDWSTVNGIVWHTTGYSTQCGDSRVVNTHALTNGYVLQTNGTGSDIIIPANTPIVFVITDTIGISHRLIGTLEVLAT
jgi:hypothetical protein